MRGGKGAESEVGKKGPGGDKTTALTLAALGVDPAICGLVRSDGTLAQRAYQRFVTLTLEPMARILESELRMKLDVPELEIHFRRLHGTDLPALAGFVPFDF